MLILAKSLCSNHMTASSGLAWRLPLEKAENDTGLGVRNRGEG